MPFVFSPTTRVCVWGGGGGRWLYVDICVCPLQFSLCELFVNSFSALTLSLDQVRRVGWGLIQCIDRQHYMAENSSKHVEVTL